MGSAHVEDVVQLIIALKATSLNPHNSLTKVLGSKRPLTTRSETIEEWADKD